MLDRVHFLKAVVQETVHKDSLTKHYDKFNFSLLTAQNDGSQLPSAYFQLKAKY